MNVRQERTCKKNMEKEIHNIQHDFWIIWHRQPLTSKEIIKFYLDYNQLIKKINNIKKKNKLVFKNKFN